MAAFRINISKLSEGEHVYSLEADAAEIGLAEEFSGLIKVEAVLQKSPRQVFLKAQSESTKMFACDRCLESSEIRLDASFEMLFVTENVVPEDQEAESEVQVISPDTNYIDLDEDVRQFLLLAVPPKLLCREDCQGLCQNCGKNLNQGSCSCLSQETDTRWDGLRKLVQN